MAHARALPGCMDLQGRAEIARCLEVDLADVDGGERLGRERCGDECFLGTASLPCWPWCGTGRHRTKKLQKAAVGRCHTGVVCRFSPAACWEEGAPVLSPPCCRPSLAPVFHYILPFRPLLPSLRPPSPLRELLHEDLRRLPTGTGDARAHRARRDARLQDCLGLRHARAAARLLDDVGTRCHPHAPHSPRARRHDPVAAPPHGDSLGHRHAGLARRPEPRRNWHRHRLHRPSRHGSEAAPLAGHAKDGWRHPPPARRRHRRNRGCSHPHAALAGAGPEPPDRGAVRARRQWSERPRDSSRHALRRDHLAPASGRGLRQEP